MMYERDIYMFLVDSLFLMSFFSAYDSCRVFRFFHVFLYVLVC